MEIGIARTRVAIGLAAVALASSTATAQELEPRLFSPAPTGTNIVLGAFGYSRIRFSLLLSGAPALNQKEFAAYRPGTIVGRGLQVWAPLGQYDPARLLNLGSNRWAFRP